MSKFYGTVKGASMNEATRRGHHSIKTSAQSYDGSISTELRYNDNGQLVVSIYTADCSSTYGNRIFYGTFEEYIQKLTA